MIRTEHLSRQLVLQALYQANIMDISIEDSYDSILCLLDEEIKDSFEENYPNEIFPEVVNSVQNNKDIYNNLLLYCKELILGISKKREEFVVFLEKNDKSRSIDRLNIPVLSILILAMYEIKYVKNVPYKVAINEALELCEFFAEDMLKPYVNSVLQTYVDNEI